MTAIPTAPNTITRINRSPPVKTARPLPTVSAKGISNTTVLTARKATSRAKADISHVKAVTSSAQEDSVQGDITMGATSNARADITRTASKGAISSAMPSSGLNRLKPSARPAQQQQPLMRQLLTQQPHRPPNIPAVINHARATSPVRVISHAITTRGATSSAREATTRTANREATSSAPVATTTRAAISSASTATASRKAATSPVSSAPITTRAAAISSVRVDTRTVRAATTGRTVSRAAHSHARVRALPPGRSVSTTKCPYPILTSRYASTSSWPMPVCARAVKQMSSSRKGW